MTLLVGSIFHVTRKIVSEMTYNVSMGTLNPILYPRRQSFIAICCSPICFAWFILASAVTTMQIMRMQRRQSWGAGSPQYFAKRAHPLFGPPNKSAVTCHEVGNALTAVWHVGPIMQHFRVQNESVNFYISFTAGSHWQKFWSQFAFTV